MTGLPRPNSAIAWYRPVPGSASRDIAHEAYLAATEYLKKEISKNDKAREVLDSYTSIDDIRSIVEKAKTSYDESSEKKKRVHKWLSRFSSRIMYYGQALDMLAQHHPEYVALAWGAVKFVLMGVLNHADLVHQLAKALVHIGNVLPRTKLNAELYQTDHMKETISSLYAHIIIFFQQAVKWYNMNSASRVWSSIIKPFDLDWRDIVEQIKICSETVNDIANAASRVEIRDINIMVQMQDRKLEESYAKLHEMQVQLKDMQMRIDGRVEKALQIVTNHKAITEGVQLNIKDMRLRISDIQFSHVLNLLSPPVSPETTLWMCQSLARRRQSWDTSPKDSIEFLQSLRYWVSVSGSSLFVVRAGPRAEVRAKDFAVRVTSFLRSTTSYKVIWSFSPLGLRNNTASTTGILKTLIFQTLRHDPNILNKSPQLNISQFQADHTEKEWLDLLCVILSQLSECFVIVETKDLFHSFKHDPKWTIRFLQLFQHVIDTTAASGSTIKILVVSYGQTLSALANLPQNSSRIIASIQQPPLVPARLRKLMSRKRGRDLYWQSLRPRF